MHMADALLSPAVGGAGWAGTAGMIAYASKALAARRDERKIPLMGVLGAFLFAAQMINFTIPGTGSSGHLAGGLLLAVLLGPHAAFLVMASVLTVQALFFADGGLLALGCNIWNLGFYPCFVAHPLVYRPLAGRSPGSRRILLASLAGAVASLQLGAFSVVLQVLFSGRAEIPAATFLPLMQGIHLAIGIVEGFVTAGVINAVRSIRPEIAGGEAAPAARAALRPVLAGFAAAAVLAGGVLCWFASTDPDGLEWSVERAAGTKHLAGPESALHRAMRTVQEKTSILPDYGFPGARNEPRPATDPPHRPAADAGASISGLVGATIVLGMVLGIGWAVRALRAKRSA